MPFVLKHAQFVMSLLFSELPVIYPQEKVTLFCPGGIGVWSVSEQKTCNISEMVRDRTKVTMAD